MGNKAIFKDKAKRTSHRLRRIICYALAFSLLLTLGSCQSAGQEAADDGTSSPVQTPAATPTPTPAPTPEPTPFSYDNVFGEVFSDEALSALYPDIEDYEKERTRISGNIARIEDFEFYELSAEQQEFVKLAQQGDIDGSSAEELREVLTKIYEKDPYVFDDVDNVLKIDNRVDIIST